MQKNQTFRKDSTNGLKRVIGTLPNKESAANQREIVFISPGKAGRNPVTREKEAMRYLTRPKLFANFGYRIEIFLETKSFLCSKNEYITDVIVGLNRKNFSFNTTKG
mgnify:FL=1